MQPAPVTAQATGLAATAQQTGLVAARLVRAQQIVGPGDLVLSSDAGPGAERALSDALGQEARVMLHPGRPVHARDLGPPALVERNQIVRLIYRSGGLSIMAEGRALGRAAEGEGLRVLNLSSRTTVSGIVAPGGHVVVSPRLP
ncbi:MAG: flagellar basal body P-ring formation protein FlgA [Rhodobacteraceae bacterium]|nr:flagellar basal body P-ring formation protein FlgA [Paracoccaceae bacterium]